MAGTGTTTTRTSDETRDELRDTILRAAEEAREILEAAEEDNRELTDDERAQVDELLLRAEGLQARLQRVKNRASFSTAVPDIASLFGGSTNGPLSKTRGAASWGAAVVAQCTDGVRRWKGLTPSGSVLVDVPAPEPVAQGRPVASLRSLIPAEETGGVFAFLRQVERVQNAAPVATGALKPTSRYGFERVQDRARVIAHLSESIARQDLADAPLLQDFVGTEMSWGLEMALEAQILSGDGVGENFAGLSVTPGVQTVSRLNAEDYGLMRTLRRGITRLESLGLEGTGWVMNPLDYEAIETAVDDDGQLLLTSAGQTVPIDRAARRLWGLPVVSTPSCPAGLVWLADWIGSTKLYVRSEATIDWSEHLWDASLGATLYEHNLVRFRVEGRFGFAVTRPSGVVKISLT